MGYPAIHLFFCVNEKEDPEKPCCARRGGREMFAYAKARVEALGLKTQGVRVNQSGCLGQCRSGPVCVMYPEGRWCHYRSREDIDRVLEDLCRPLEKADS